MNLSELNIPYDNKTIIKMFCILIIIILVIISLLWCYSKFTLNNRNCINMNYLYRNFPPLTNTKNTQYKLRDYYVKSAYNCCAPGGYNHNFVNICALKNCIKQGARCLDFQIYSVNNEPVVAVSSVSDFSVKGSYNSIKFSSAMNIISDYAFSGSTCPCPKDPLIIHLRIMTNNTTILDKIANILQNVLKNRLLGKEYSYEYHSTNIGLVELNKLLGKAIIVVDKSLVNPGKSNLDEYINITSNSAFMRCTRFRDIKYSPDTEEITNFNKKNMTISLPDISAKPNNPSPALAMKYGCQFVSMCMQKNDSNLKYYNTFFNNEGCSFVLKPKELRYIPVTIEVPKPPPKEYSYKEREVKSDYYSFKI